MATIDNNVSGQPEPSLGSVLAQLTQQLENSNAGLGNRFEQLSEATQASLGSVTNAIQSNPSAAPSSGRLRETALNVLSPISSRSPLQVLSNLVLGPVWRGLFGLFGSRGETPAPALTPFVRPANAATELDSRADGAGNHGALRTDSFGQSKALNQSAPIHISIQALDARSLLDRSDEIASAVRQAMLTNHPINESMTEL
jgi:hypothetical protein